MKFTSYACLRCGKGVKCTSALTRYVNACKILIILLSRQPSTLAPILEYNITNYPDLPSNNFEEDISLGISTNGNKRIRPGDINKRKRSDQPI